MKKSLSKILARMAKDGDIETVAEIIEEMLEPEAAPAEAAEEVVEAVEEVAEEPAAVVETPEGTTVVVDEATLADVISRLDQIISLLTAAPAMDESPVEEIAEAVEAVAEEQVVEELPMAAEEVAEIVEEILDPDTADPQPDNPGEGDGACGEPQPEVISTGDALRAALKIVRPALAKLPKKQRERVCADIAARLNGETKRAGVYGAIQDAKAAAAGPELGKRIMASRNPNYMRNRPNL